MMKSAMRCLADAAPLPLHCDALLAAARTRLGRDAGDGAPEEPRQLAVRLLNCHLSNMVDFSTSAPDFVKEVSDRPVASLYARLRAKEGGKIVNRRLESIQLSEPSRLVLQHLDGQHDRQSLIDLITRWIESRPAAAASATDTSAMAEPTDPLDVRATKYVIEVLQAFARSALLIA